MSIGILYILVSFTITIVLILSSNASVSKKPKAYKSKKVKNDKKYTNDNMVGFIKFLLIFVLPITLLVMLLISPQMIAVIIGISIIIFILALFFILIKILCRYITKFLSKNKKEYEEKININKKMNGEWQIINKHGFSFNEMYEPNPLYNPKYENSKKLRKTEKYWHWQTSMLNAMKQLKSLESMNVNPNKPMKIEIIFKLVKGSDTDNPIKSFLDVLTMHYKLKDDNNFYAINVTRDFECAKNYKDGIIKFRITNMETDMEIEKPKEDTTTKQINNKKQTISRKEKIAAENNDIQEVKTFMKKYINNEFEYMFKRNSMMRKMYTERMCVYIKKYPEIYRELRKDRY